MSNAMLEIFHRRDNGRKKSVRMKYLVIGASGFLGGRLLSVLKREVNSVVGTRASSERADLLRFNLLDDRIADCIPRSFLNSEEAGCAVVCACVCQVDRCFREREMTQILNVDNTIRLIDDLRSFQWRVVFISTGHVFDGRMGYCAEDEPFSPIHEYGRQKASVESWIKNNAPDVLVLRPGKLVSDNFEDSNMFGEWYRDVSSGKPITCISDQILAPTLVSDVCRAIIDADNRGLTGVYHVSNTEFFVREELARQFLRALNLSGSVVVKDQAEMGFAEPRPLLDYLNSTKFLEATQMRFTTTGSIFNRLRSRFRR